MDSENKRPSYLKGAMILTIGSIFARFLGLFFKVPLSRIIGDYGMGLYGYPYPIYSFLVAVSVIGLPLAISKMTSESMSLKRYDHAQRVFKISMASMMALGVLCSILIIVFAKPIIHFLGWPEETYYSIIGLSLTPIFVSYMATYRGFFQGLQMMVPTSLSQIVESVFRVIFGVALAFFLFKTKGVAWAAGGASFGGTAGAIAGGILMSFLYKAYKKKGKAIPKLPSVKYTEKTSKIVEMLFKIAIPASLGSIVVSLMNMINSVTVARCLQTAGFDLFTATELWGQLSQKVQTLINVPLMVGVGLAAALVPAISESYVRKAHGEIADKTALAMKAVMMVALPSAVGLSVLADPIIKLIFGATSAGGDMLKYLAFSCITSITYITCQAILQGLGKMMLPIRNLAIGAVIKMALNIILISIPSINIYGIIIATFVADSTITTLNYLCVKKYIKFKLNKVDVIIKPLLSSIIMGAAAYFSYQILYKIVGSNFAVLIAIAFGGGIYFISMLLCGGIAKEDIKSLLKRKH